MNPDIVTAISLLMFFSVLTVKKGFGTLLIAHIMFCIPYVMLSVTPKLRSLDPNLIDAAMDLAQRRSRRSRKSSCRRSTGYRLRRAHCVHDEL